MCDNWKTDVTVCILLFQLFQQHTPGMANQFGVRRPEVNVTGRDLLVMPKVWSSHAEKVQVEVKWTEFGTLII